MARIVQAFELKKDNTFKLINRPDGIVYMAREVTPKHLVYFAVLGDGKLFAIKNTDLVEMYETIKCARTACDNHFWPVDACKNIENGKEYCASCARKINDAAGKVLVEFPE